MIEWLMWSGAGLTGMRLIAIYSPLVLDTYSVDFRNVRAASRAIRTYVMRNANRLRAPNISHLSASSPVRGRWRPCATQRPFEDGPCDKPLEFNF